ncbi:hypothetical protein DPMN_085792 [Dreissena polymorpha]|uniref:Uncharacterized protein n=1 Tax=Dreissena polymorpha TaxID=45954 RepID=A0A9D4BM91_DREPO|nr:hypothetical protein DPMN_085792 [Dreissena polymorpha]
MKGLSKQLSEINEKPSNVMMKNDSCLEKMIVKVVKNMKNSLLHKIELLQAKPFDRETEKENLKKQLDILQTELNTEKVVNREALSKEKYSNREAINELE